MKASEELAKFIVVDTLPFAFASSSIFIIYL